MTSASLDLALQLSPSPVIVFEARPSRPADPVPPGVRQNPTRGPLVFSDFRRMYDFLQSLPDAPFAQIVVTQVLSIPAGTWDFRGAAFVGTEALGVGDQTAPPLGQQTVILEDGAELVNVRAFLRLTVRIESTGTPVLSYTSPAIPGRFADLTIGLCSVIFRAAGGVFIEADGTSFVRCNLTSSVVNRDGPVIVADGVCTFARTVNGSSRIGISVLGGICQLGADLLDSTADADSITLLADVGGLVAAQPRCLVSLNSERLTRAAPAPYTTPAILVPDQVTADANGQGQIRQAWVYWPAAGSPNFSVGDFVSITDGTTTETWTAVAGVPVGFQFQVGANAIESAQSLCENIRAASTLWTTADPVDLPLFGGLLGTNGACIIMRRAQDQNAYADRMFGTTSATIFLASFAGGAALETYAPPPGLAGFPLQQSMPTTDPVQPIAGWGSAATPAGFVVGIVDAGSPCVMLRINATNNAGDPASTTRSDGFVTDDLLVWSGDPPTNTTDAINRIAQAVAGLLAGPIP